MTKHIPVGGMNYNIDEPKYLFTEREIPLYLRITINKHRNISVTLK